MKVSIIAAIDEKRGIGKNRHLPWHIPEDLKRFKQITKGHPVIMGRKTFESIGKPLSDRTNIILSQNPNLKIQSFKAVNSLLEAMEFAKNSPGSNEVFIIGGQQVFNSAISLADKIYLTKVKGDFGCDTFFPDYSQFIKEKFIGAGEENGVKYQFLELER